MNARERRNRLLLHLAVIAIVLGVALHVSPMRRPSSAIYYVDATGGNDSANGTSPSTAWKSLSVVNRHAFKPGDQVLLKRGSIFDDQLRARWVGSPSSPIVVDTYGDGPLPEIRNQRSGNVLVTGSYLSIGHLAITNSSASFGAVDPASSRQPLGWVVGVYLDGASNVTIHDMSIRHEAAAVVFTQGAHDNHVLHNLLTDNDGAWKPSTDLNGIRGGTGVLLEGTGNEIGWNQFSGNSTMVNAESISIELYTASSSFIHDNTSADKVFVETGSDARFVSRDNRIVSNRFSATQWENPAFVVTRGNGDKYGPVYSTLVDHNSVFVTGKRAQGVVCSRCGPDILTMQNNIIVAQFKAVYVDTAQPIEGHNVFWSPAGTQNSKDFTQNLVRSPTDVVADPMFVDPATGDFRLHAGSPAQGDGPTAGSDFDGSPV